MGLDDGVHQVLPQGWTLAALASTDEPMVTRVDHNGVTSADLARPRAPSRERHQSVGEVLDTDVHALGASGFGRPLGLTLRRPLLASGLRPVGASTAA